MPKLQNFAKALGKAEKKPHVLLGNGFSQACKKDIFSYETLFEHADFKGIPLAEAAFDVLGTTDFEAVMRALHAASRLVALYEKNNPQLAERLQADADALREVLVKAIAKNHPGHPDDIPDKKYAACRAFLSNFNRIYTLNYDLLLYWALMRDELEPKNIKSDDGFRKADDPDAEYVTWHPRGSHTQNVYYLHGALHIFDEGGEIQKYTWKKTQVRLIKQIRIALATGKYPIFVAEGKMPQKVEKVWHSGFLHKAYRSFVEIGGTLFIFGNSLHENDDHILEAIALSDVQQVFVSVYGDPDKGSNPAMMAKARLLPNDRKKKGNTKPLAVEFYDAESAHVWG